MSRYEIIDHISLFLYYLTIFVYLYCQWIYLMFLTVFISSVWYTWLIFRYICWTYQTCIFMFLIFHCKLEWTYFIVSCNLSFNNNNNINNNVLRTFLQYIRYLQLKEFCFVTVLSRLHLLLWSLCWLCSSYSIHPLMLRLRLSHLSLCIAFQDHF